MDNFEKRKIEYLKMLKSEPYIMKKIIESENKSEKGQKTIEMILTPKNEMELEIGEACFKMTKDISKLVDDIIDDEVKSILPNENAGLKVLINCVNTIKNNEENLKSTLEPTQEDMAKKIYGIDKATPEYVAKIMYGLVVGMVNDTEESFKYIASETGFDLNDEIEAAQFSIYINKGKQICDSLNVTNKNFENCTDDDIVKAKELVEEFHKLCKDGKKDLENESASEKLTRALTKSIMKVIRELD